MAKISEEVLYDLIYRTESWLKPVNYEYFDKSDLKKALLHYEIRALLFLFFDRGNDEFKDQVRESDFYKSILNGSIHKLKTDRSKDDLKIKNYQTSSLQAMAEHLRYVEAGKERSPRTTGYRLNLVELPSKSAATYRSLYPVSWSDINGLYKSEKSPFIEDNRNQMNSWDYLLALGSYPDLDIQNGMLSISIKLEADDEQIHRDIDKILSIWRNKQKNLKLENKNDLNDLVDHKLLMLCDLILWCKIEEFQSPTAEVAKKTIFGEEISRGTLNKTYMPRANRLLNWPHILHLWSLSSLIV